jgi:pSer/pThr/pTyr-binding forkhead associated (FHA) protein
VGKDVDGACCDTCRQFGHVDAVLPEPPSPVAIGTTYDRARILVRERGGEDREVIPSGPIVVVGRVPGNDVVLRSGTISKRQCRFVFKEDGRVLVEDMKSSCGTYVNGRKQSVAEIHEGSVVSMGDFELRVTSRDR